MVSLFFWQLTLPDILHNKKVKTVTLCSKFISLSPWKVHLSFYFPHVGRATLLHISSLLQTKHFYTVIPHSQEVKGPPDTSPIGHMQQSDSLQPGTSWNANIHQLVVPPQTLCMKLNCLYFPNKNHGTHRTNTTNTANGASKIEGSRAIIHPAGSQSRAACLLSTTEQEGEAGLPHG